MKKIAMISFVVAILGLVPAAMAQITSGECVELITDGGDEFTATDIGEVCVENDGETLTVTYYTDGGPWWSLLTTHLHVWNPLEDGGPKLVGGGNPVPGQFAWQVPDAETATSATFNIPLVGNYPGKGKKTGDAYDWTGDIINIAAHSVVGNGLCDCELLLEALPDSGTMTIAYPGSETSSYVTITFDPDSILSGDLPGWCAEADTDITEGDYPETLVYSSLCDDLETDRIATDNLGSVNWVVNNREGYTDGDVQYVIWMLLSGKLPDNPEVVLSIVGTDEDPAGYFTAGQGYDAERAAPLLAESLENDGFVPSCGEVMVVVLIPPSIPVVGAPDIPQQIMLVEIPAPCCETAWGGTVVELGGDDDSDENGWGLDFPGSNWAMYFTYQVVE